MNKLLPILLAFFAIYSNAQVQSGSDLQRLFDQKKFDEIINYMPINNEKLNANDLYYKGMAYYMKSEDDKANHFFDLAIEKGPGNGSVFFTKE